MVESKPNHSISVPHFLYANGTLIFCGAETLQVLYLNLTLMLFEAISGLHINKMKSKIYNVTEVPNLFDLAKILGCDTVLSLSLT